MSTSVCGVIGGVINIGVGLYSLKEAIQALKNGDRLGGIRMAFDAFCITGIGLVMILVSLGKYIPHLHGISSTLTNTSWILPVIFFVITLPLITEIAIRMRKIVTHQDIASKLNLKAIQHAVAQETAAWDEAQDQIKWFLKGTETREELSSKMEETQAEMGVSCALKLFKLFEHVQEALLVKAETSEIIQGLEGRISPDNQEENQNLLDEIERIKKLRDQELLRLKNKTSALLPKIEKKVKAWNNAQWVRFAQQIFYIVAFVISMGALCPKAPAAGLNAGTSFGLAAANAIPLYMDTFWPFKRNTPIVVPKVK
ncbi:MAG: hypothetical protein KBC64_01970 [Simkaniaceae bacterium]|nr:hypothetical protein [Simkaniaceae bacterium]